MKILCFGDSNTYGYDPRSFFGGRYPGSDRWTDRLSELLGCVVINEGENGREIPCHQGELFRFSQLIAEQKPVDLLVVMLGSNDLLQGNSVNEVVERMECFLSGVDLERSRILVIGPPPMQLGVWVPTQSLVDRSKELNDAYKALAQRLGIRFADAGEWEPALTFDGVHFTAEGHRAFADGLYQYLTKEITYA